MNLALEPTDKFPRAPRTPVSPADGAAEVTGAVKPSVCHIMGAIEYVGGLCFAVFLFRVASDTILNLSSGAHRLYL